MPLPISLIIEVDGIRSEVVPTFGEQPIVIEGTGAPAKLIVVAPWKATISEQVTPGTFRNAAGCDPVADLPNGYQWRNDIVPGAKTIYVNFPSAAFFFGFKIDYRLKPTPPAPVTRWNGTISDNGSVAQNVIDARKLGFDTMRIWFGWGATTGKLNDPNDIANANAYVNAGMNVVVCLTPETDKQTVVYPAGAIVDIIARLDKRVIVQIINEANQEHYWPQAKWTDAFAVASRISTELQAAGFKTGSPSFTYQHVDSIKSWWKKNIADGYTNFDYIDGHSYPVIQPWETGLAEAVANHEAVVKTYREIAESLGKKCMMSEWGMYGEKTKFAAAWPQLDKIVKKYTDASAYFIMREIAKHSQYGLHLIDSTGNQTALGNVAKAAAPVDVKKN